MTYVEHTGTGRVGKALKWVRRWGVEGAYVKFPGDQRDRWHPLKMLLILEPGRREL